MQFRGIIDQKLELKHSRFTLINYWARQWFDAAHKSDKMNEMLIAAITLEIC
jgi:hypothetical protein